MDELVKFIERLFEVGISFIQLLDFILQLLVAKLGMAMMLVMVVASNATDWAQAEYSKNSTPSW